MIKIIPDRASLNSVIRAIGELYTYVVHTLKIFDLSCDFISRFIFKNLWYFQSCDYDI